MFRDEKISSLRQTVKTSPDSVAKLTFICDTLYSEATARTSEVAVLQILSLSVAFGPSQSEYDAVVRECDHFASNLRSLTDHTSRLENEFGNLFHQTRASLLVTQRFIWHLREDFRLQPDPLDEMDDNGLPQIEWSSCSSINFFLCLHLAMPSL